MKRLVSTSIVAGVVYALTYAAIQLYDGGAVNYLETLLSAVAFLVFFFGLRLILDKKKEKHEE